MVKIRLRRIGAKKTPSYRIVVADSRAPRDGAFIAAIGHYNPLTDPETIVIDQEKAMTWLKQGAQPTDTAARLLAKAGIIQESASRKERMKAGAPKVSKKKRVKTTAEKPKAEAAEEPKAETAVEEPEAATTETPEAGLTKEAEASVTEKPKASKEEPKTAAKAKPATSEEPAEPTTETSEEPS